VVTTLREHLSYCGQEELLRQMRRISPESYEEFIDSLYEDLDELIGLVERDAKDFVKASEDEISRELVRLLLARFYWASHDSDEGGHVDIRVAAKGEKYTWLAEAKLDDGPAYLLAGVKQLTERYARGTPNHNCGAFLVYIQKERSRELFARWREYFAKESELEELKVEDCSARPDMAFFSDFVLPRIGGGGSPYRVRHIGISACRTASVATASSVAANDATPVTPAKRRKSGHQSSTRSRASRGSG
jgi:hypothetical protein